MRDLGEFFAMGGYAMFVWPSFLVTLLALGGVVFWSQLEYRRVRRETFRQASVPRSRRGRMRATEVVPADHGTLS